MSSWRSILGSSPSHDDDHWISVSDLMAGLMVLFLFIAIAYIQPISVQNENLERRDEDIYRALLDEFKDDLPKWNATLTPDTLIIRFREPDILFDRGQSAVKDDFKNILSSFFPRYLKIIYRLKFRDAIKEVRIEGHTSSEWEGAESVNDAYFSNMELSQDRTRAVLRYCLTLDKVKNHREWPEWARDIITANGLSSSNLIRVNDIEDSVLSRRVEFRIVTNTKEEIRKIVDKYKGASDSVENEDETGY